MNAVVDLELLLSPKHYQVVQQVAQGVTIPQAAINLSIKPGTARTYLRIIRKRFHLKSCAELRAAIRAADGDHHDNADSMASEHPGEGG